MTHDAHLAGQPGTKRTLELIKRHFWWPQLTAHVTAYVKAHDVRARSKHTCQQPSGLLIDTPLAERPWDKISVDFIVDLPISSGYTTILVVVDILTKMSHIIPLPKLPSAKDTATAMLHHVFKLHGYFR